MSHLHLPDGILPFWLVLSGWILTIFSLSLALAFARGAEANRRLSRLGFVAALMLTSMSIELLAYHLNLSALAGILLGPALGFLAAFLVDLILALVGHGGLTVLGLNAMILGAEVSLGSLFFKTFRSIGLSPPKAAGAATFSSLFVGSSLMAAVVWLAKIQPSLALEQAHPQHFRAFLTFIYGFGSIGWFIEALLTAGIVRYLSRLRPGFLEESC